MKGLWKQNVPIWNKDSKRKKTKFKHILKDNFNLIRKREDSLPEHVYKEDFKLVSSGTRKSFRAKLKNSNFEIPLYKLRIYKNRLKEGEILGTTFAFLNDKYHWIEINGKSLLMSISNIKFEHIESIHIGYIRNPFYEENIKYNKEIIEKEFYDKNVKTFIYGKPNISNNFSYKRGIRKKHYQTYVDRITRRIVKNWIKKGNFEEAIHFNPLQKSIGWLIS